MIRGNSNKAQAQPNSQHYQQQRNQPQQLAAATRNLYNRQQPLQHDQSQYRPQRNNYGGSGDTLSGLYQTMGAASTGRGEANDEDDSGMGPNFGAGANFDAGDNENESEGSGPSMNLNQAASGYPAQGDYNNEPSLGNFGFGPGNGYSSADAEFGPSEFGNEGRRSKSASSPLGSRGFGVDDDAGAPQYGPNSAINAGDADDDRAGYSPDSQADNDNDDE